MAKRATKPAVPRGFSQVLNVWKNDNISPEAFGERVAFIARNARDQLIKDGRASPNYTTTVDGAGGVPEEQVKRNIHYQFGYIGQIAAFLIDYLKANSPASSSKGRAKATEGPAALSYKDQFYIAVNGRAMRVSSFDQAQCPPDAEIYIFNDQPYGRKVDVQRVGSESLVFSIPAGLFLRAQGAARRRFGVSVNIDRVDAVMNPPFQWLSTQSKTARKRIAKGHKGSLTQYPAIRISLTKFNPRG